MATQAVKARNDEAQGGGPAAVTGLAGRIADGCKEKWLASRRFLHEVRVETRQVTWPSSADVVSTTAVVIVTVFFFGLFFFFVDTGFSRLVQWIFNYFKA